MNINKQQKWNGTKVHLLACSLLLSFGWSCPAYLFATYISCQVTDMWSKFHKSKIGTKSCFAGAFHIHRHISSSSRYTHFTRQKNRFASYSTTQYYYSLFPNGKQSRVKTTFSPSSRVRMFYGNFLWWFLLWHTNYHLVNVCDLALKQRVLHCYSMMENEKGWYFAIEIRLVLFDKKWIVPGTFSNGPISKWPFRSYWLTHLVPYSERNHLLWLLLVAKA